MKPLLRTLFSLPLVFAIVSVSWAAQSGAEYRFRGIPDGSQPNGGLVADGAGNFYGTTSAGALASVALAHLQL